MLVDTHTHLFLENFDADIDCVLQDAYDQGVEKMLLPHIDSESTARMLELASRCPGLCIPMMGLHPGSVKEDYQKELEHVEELLKSHSFIALGEIGMDLYWDKTFRNEQEIVFRTHLKWAEVYHLPLVIHSRNAEEELILILEEFPAHTFRGVFHSFTGSLEQARRAIRLGFYIGINGIITFKNSGLDKMARGIGTKNILLETDSPYLAPVPYRGKRNESAYLTYIAMKLADLYEISIEEMADITSQNAYKLFDIIKFKR